MKKYISFGKFAVYGKRKENEIEISISIKEKDGFHNLAIRGYVWNRLHTDTIVGGQCLDTIAKHVNNPDFNFWYQMWKRYHLNDMHAGTPRQEAFLNKIRKTEEYTREKGDTYTKDCYFLKRVGLLEDCAEPRYSVQFMNKNSKQMFWMTYKSEADAECDKLKRPNYIEVGFRHHGYRYGTEWLKQEIEKKDLDLIFNKLESDE